MREIDIWKIEGAIEKYRLSKVGDFSEIIDLTWLEKQIKEILEVKDDNKTTSN